MKKHLPSIVFILVAGFLMIRFGSIDTPKSEHFEVLSGTITSISQESNGEPFSFELLDSETSFFLEKGKSLVGELWKGRFVNLLVIPNSGSEASKVRLMAWKVEGGNHKVLYDNSVVGVVRWWLVLIILGTYILMRVVQVWFFKSRKVD